MRVIVAGGHGQIGLRLLRLLVEHGDEGVGLIRNPDHAADLAGEALVLDLEGVDEVGPLEADAIVFAAGAGPGSGAERKWTMDYGGAVKLMRAGVQRYVIVSAMGAADPPPEGEGDVFGEYVRAKARADQDLMASDLQWTVVRPGRLTDESGTGRVHVAERLPRGEIPRDDVARVLHAVLHEPSTVGEAFDLVSGDTPIDEALDRL